MTPPKQGGALPIEPEGNWTMAWRKMVEERDDWMKCASDAEFAAVHAEAEVERLRAVAVRLRDALSQNHYDNADLPCPNCTLLADPEVQAL